MEPQPAESKQSQWDGDETGEIPRFSSEAIPSEQVSLEGIPSEEAFGAPAGAQPAASPPPSPPDRRFLGRAGNTRLYVTQEEGQPLPLDLPVDAVVIPTDSQADFHETFASHAMSILGDAWDDFESEVRSGLGAGQLLPDRPVFRSVSPQDRSPLTLVAATSWISASEGASLEGVERAVQAVIVRSKHHAVRCLAIPLFDTRGGLPPVQVVRTLLSAVQSALPGAPWIQEVTVIAQEDDAYEEAVLLFTRAPQQFANDLPGGDDLLDVASEVQALTDILLLKSLQPPLAVGILGGWGSGKSFAMELMRRHIQRIRSLPPQGRWDGGQPGDYVGHVYPITFDAWTYAKSNLWASLMQTIFLELSRQVRLEQRLRDRQPPLTDELEGSLWLAFQGLSDRDREFLSQQGVRDVDQEHLDGEAGKALWDAVARAREKDRKALDAKQLEMAKKAAEIETKRGELERKVDQELADRAYLIAWKGAAPALQELVKKVVKETPGADSAAKDGEAVKEFLHQAGEDFRSVPLGFRSFWEAVKRNPVVIAMSVLASLACGGLAWVIYQNQREIALAIAWLGPALSLLAGFARTASSWRARIASAWKTLDREVRSAEARVERERENLRVELQSSAEAEELRKLEEQQRRLDTEIQALRQQIGFTVDYVSVADLVQARLTKAEYEGELGPLHRVQRDLQELSQALCPSSDPEHLKRLAEQFPRGPARIVLFIDDLDRCPPDRVVEVLEAVQLLVKTPLFVVVLAMDVRYITRALEKVYEGILLRRGKPSGLDYIEKIIQLPYSVRPIDTNHVERFLRGQMEVQPEAEASPPNPPSPTPSPSDASGGSGSPAAPVEEPKPVTPEVVTFTADELGWLRSCCQALPLSPRAVKRVVNALKLLKIVWSRPNRHSRPEPDVQQAFVALLALSAAWPDAMRVVFSVLSERARDQVLPDLHVELTMALDSQEAQESCTPEEIEGLRQKAILVPAGAQLLPHLRPTLELVRSLSFVAEIGYDPADVREAWETRAMLKAR